MPLTESEVAAYMGALTEDQAEVVSTIRNWIAESGQALDERIETGKWYTGLLVYDAPGGITAFALGPRSGGFTTFHMMPFYGSPELQARHGATLKPCLTGKSCVKFRRTEQIPAEAIREIIAAGPRFAETAREMLAARKRK